LALPLGVASIGVKIENFTNNYIEAAMPCTRTLSQFVVLILERQLLKSGKPVEGGSKHACVEGVQRLQRRHAPKASGSSTNPANWAQRDG